MNNEDQPVNVKRGPTCPRCASHRVQQIGLRRWHCVACQKRWSVRSPSPRLHYYAKCVAILSKAKPWERVRVVKALCLLVGINRQDRQVAAKLRVMKETLEQIANSGNRSTRERRNARATLCFLDSMRKTGFENWHDCQRAVALECFRIVQGPGDVGSEAAFNCLLATEQSGWLQLAARIIDSQNS